MLQAIFVNETFACGYVCALRLFSAGKNEDSKYRGISEEHATRFFPSDWL